MKPLACAACGLLFIHWPKGKTACPQCENQGPLARLSVQQSVEAWRLYQQMKTAQQPRRGVQ